MFYVLVEKIEYPVGSNPITKNKVYFFKIENDAKKFIDYKKRYYIKQEHKIWCDYCMNKEKSENSID